MEHLQEQLAKIEQDLSAEKQKGPEGDQTIIARLESEQAHILEQIMLAEQQERAEVIEQKVAAIELPYDFNELYDNSTANDTIIEIVQQFQRQAYDERNADIDQINAGWKARLDELTNEWSAAKTQLQTQNGELQTVIDGLEDRAVQQQIEYLNLAASRDDYQQKLANAATQLEENEKEIKRLNSHVDDLIKEQAVGAREAYKVIESNQTLDQLIQRANEEKQAKIKSSMELALENSAPFRGKINLPEIKQQENQFRDFPAIESNGNQLPSAQVDETVNQEATFPSAPNVEYVHAPILGNKAQPTGFKMAEHSNDGKVLAEQGVSREEHEALKSRVEALESKVA